MYKRQEHVIGFVQFADVPGTQPGMTVILKPRVTFSDIVIRSPREVEIELIIEFFVKVIRLVQLDVVTDVMFKSVPVKVEKQLFRVERVRGENTGQVILSNMLPVPAGKPDVQKILSIANVTVSATGTPLPNKVVIEGTATVQTIYVAAEPDQPVHHMEHVIGRCV